MGRSPLTAVLLAGAAGLVLAGPAAAQLPPPPSTAPAQRPAQPPKPKPPAPRPQAPATTQPATPPAAVTGGAQPQLLGQYGGWGAYTASPGGRKVCFALAKPSRAETTPPNRPRDPAFLFVASRPGERVKDEISVIFGYGFKPNADATLDVGGASFALYTQADGGWIKNAAEEARLVETLRRAGDATIKGVSARGTASTDVYVLKGLAQALDRVAQECQ
ncbi:invasion associated locus B family protein [Rhodoplanes azumiensis]|uniref:Invasion associated locus B family protein n=1 Tax=Rhodoplanes azumiensis TaxID=1897628 RepID=A0ABW5AMK4_9BRAD